MQLDKAHVPNHLEKGLACWSVHALFVADDHLSGHANYLRKPSLGVVSGFSSFPELLPDGCANFLIVQGHGNCRLPTSIDSLNVTVP
jgi:hypothetical protein